MFNLQSKCIRCCIIFAIIFPLLIGVGICVYWKFLQEVNKAISLSEKEAKLNYTRILSLNSGLPQNNSIPPGDCLTPECIELLSSINGSVDPCEHFYKFACGGQIRKKSLAFPPVTKLDKHKLIINVLNQPKMASDTKPLNQVREFYKQCLDIEKTETSMQSLTQIINKFGGWHILHPEKWNASNFSFWTTSAKIQSSGLSTAIISTGYRADIAPGTLGLPIKALQNPPKHSNLISAYKKLIMDVIKEFPHSQEAYFIQLEVEKMINLEKQLANIIGIKNEMGLNQIQELKKFAKGIGLLPLETFVSAVFNAFGRTINEKDVILINNINYFKNLKILLDKTEQTTIANYAVWMAIFPIIQHGDKELREAYFRFEKSLKGNDKSWQENCLDQAEEHFGIAIGGKYFKEIDEKMKSEIKSFVSDIRAAVKKTVMKITGISDYKKWTLLKISEGAIIDHLDWLEDSKLVEKYFEGVELKDSYFDSQISLIQFKMRMDLKSLHSNAFALPFIYSHLQNFNATGPKHQNYGREGWQIAREMFHAINNKGIYDLKSANCLKEQYNEWEYSEVGMNVDGEQSFAENIADKWGLMVSYKAYQKYLERNRQKLKLPGLEGFTPEQLFFLGNANSNCDAFESNEELIYFLLTSNKAPSEVRVQISFQNFPEFSRVFNCEVDPDGMNIPDEDRC